MFTPIISNRYNKTILASARARALCACLETVPEDSDTADAPVPQPTNNPFDPVFTPDEIPARDAIGMPNPQVPVSNPGSEPNEINPVFGPITNSQNSLGGFIFGGSGGGLLTGGNRALRTLLPQLSLQVKTQFLDEFTGSSNTFQFSAADEVGNTIFMNLEIRQGTNGNYIAFLGNSNFNNQSELNALMAELANSATFGSPAPSGNQVNLAGIVLQASSTNAGSVGGEGIIGGEDESFLFSCTTGQYHFFSKSSFFAGGGEFGGEFGGEKTDTLEHIENFESNIDFAGNQILSLLSQQRDMFTFKVAPNNGGEFLDQTFYQQTGTSEQQCG